LLGQLNQKDPLCPSDERTITLDYATKGRSAVAGSDYEAVSGSITYLPGEQEKTVTVTTMGDFRREGLAADLTHDLLERPGLVAVS